MTGWRRTLAGAIALTLVLVLGAGPLQAAEPELPAGEQDHYQHLIREFRCVVCQNRSIASSDAPLAGDLRAIVARQITAGQSDAEIKAYLVSRYGDWILYDPPFKWTTWALWLGPFVLLAIGLGWIALIVRGRRRRAAGGADTGEDADMPYPARPDTARLNALLAAQDEPVDTPDRDPR